MVFDTEAWEELGIDLEGEPLGAGSYHPRALLGIWIYGFMTGVRSSRKMEEACPRAGLLHVAGGNAATRPQHSVAIL